ncbi:glycosyltransferase involved in cell wall biosynthesis [Ilumatobacter fluminis]|uniref:Glycosyltransferase involved in cell wall biosynthesis n=1 Tax=Ilumatobacter fluminis TaxID=467091 RepID=A0A4R7I486_9ACTN|nr:glycosyltransferase [Ilumatobacter fluminis]TDT18482.1 glycosyltransferase involved in cell wall biosynthesis [Ilumatobacter fluminis]
MRVALFDDRPHGIYGAKLTSLALLDGLREAGNDAVVISVDDGPFLQRAEAIGFETSIVRQPPSLRRYDRTILHDGVIGKLRSAAAALATNWRVARRCRELEVDAVLANSIRSVLLLGATNRIVAPVIWYVQIQQDFGRLSRLAARCATRRVGLSEAVASTSAGLDDVVPIGLELDPFTTLDRAGAEPDLVLSVGGFFPRKGLVDNVHAVAAAQRILERRLRLRIVGGVNTPDEREERERVAAAAALDEVDVEFAGWTDDVAAELERAAVVVHLAHAEGTPRALIEGSAAAIPIIASDVGATASVVTDAVTGFVVEPGDHVAAGDRIARLLADPELAAKMGVEGRTHVAEHFASAAMIDAFVGILDTVRRN